MNESALKLNLDSHRTCMIYMLAYLASSHLSFHNIYYLYDKIFRCMMSFNLGRVVFQFGRVVFRLGHGVYIDRR